MTTTDYQLMSTTYAVVDVWTKRRVGPTSDVFIKYLDDAPILLGQITRTELGDWAARADHSESEDYHMLVRKRDAVYHLLRTEGLKHFDAAHFQYGRLFWRLKRI